MTNEGAPGAEQGAGCGDQTNHQQEDQILNIIPETDEARQAVREWAESWVVLRAQHRADDFEEPAWPNSAMPWWATEVDAALESGGEVSVFFAHEIGDVAVVATVSVVVDDRNELDANHPGAHAGDILGNGDGVTLSVLSGPSGLTLDDGRRLFDSLAQATALLVQIEGVAGLRSKIEAHFESEGAE